VVLQVKQRSLWCTSETERIRGQPCHMVAILILPLEILSPVHFQHDSQGAICKCTGRCCLCAEHRAMRCHTAWRLTQQSAQWLLRRLV